MISDQTGIGVTAHQTLEHGSRPENAGEDRAFAADQAESFKTLLHSDHEEGRSTRRDSVASSETSCSSSFSGMAGRRTSASSVASETSATSASSIGSDSSLPDDTSSVSSGRTSGSAGSMVARREAQRQSLLRARAEWFSAQGPNDVKNEICRNFVNPEHLNSISAASKLGGFAVSFRAAGELTLKRLALGAPAKGHDILEKTIKPETVLDAVGAKDPSRMQAYTEANIDGYVGHRQGSRLLGLYMDPATSSYGSSPDASRRNLASALRMTPDGKPYYPVDEDRLEESLATLKSVPDWERLPFTGDLDEHDVILLQGRRSPVASGSADAERVNSWLNSAVASTDPNRPLSDTARHLVQHESQYGYVAHMRSEEKERPLVASVARPDDGAVAMCDRGDWSLIAKDDLPQFYKQKGVTMKSTWREEGGLALKDDGGHKVRLHHRPAKNTLQK